MAEIGRFFDGPAYGAQAHAEFYTNFLSTGFFWGLDVTANNTLEVTVASGAAFLEGHEYRNTESLNLEHNIADSTNDRIDRVVIRLDNTPDAERPLRAMIRSGMPNSDPEPPELIRNDAIYEISLAQVLVEAGKSYIEQYQITDERGDIDLCGRVSQPAVLTDQISEIDVKLPSTRASEYIRGHSIFYVGTGVEGALQSWLDSVGFDPASVGRSLNQIRVYVETNASRTDTGIQTVTVFDFAQQRDYQVYGKYIRTSNSSVAAPTSWGRWHEEVLIYDQGETSNGNYIMYTNGEVVCTYDGFNISGTTNEIGALYRSNALLWNYPVPFDLDHPIYFSGGSSTSSRWVIQSGIPGDTGIPFRVMSATSSQPSDGISVFLQAKGRWRD